MSTATEALQKLMSTDEVAEILGCTPRQVRKLPIRFVRVGEKLRRYKTTDVQAYINGQTEEGRGCRSSNAKTRRTTSRISKSPDIDFAEALRRLPVEMP